jgi:hypothetical protein
MSGLWIGHLGVCLPLTSSNWNKIYVFPIIHMHFCQRWSITFGSGIWIPISLNLIFLKKQKMFAYIFFCSWGEAFLLPELAHVLFELFSSTTSEIFHDYFSHGFCISSQFHIKCSNLWNNHGKILSIIFNVMHHVLYLVTKFELKIQLIHRNKKRKHH